MELQIQKTNIATSDRGTTLSLWISNIRNVVKETVSHVVNAAKIVGKALTEFLDAIYQHLQTQDRFYWILMQLGWPPPIYAYDKVDEFCKIVETYESSGLDSVKEKVDSVMFQWHGTEQLIEILHDWKKATLLKSRIHILEPCIKAYIQGEYSLVVPALLPQVEGIIVSGCQLRGRINSNLLKQNFEALLHEALFIKNKNESIRNFVINVLMVQFVYGKPINSSLSRHAILHGADIHYGTKVNSLKLILLIENLRNLFRLETIESSNKFHHYGCPSLQYSTKKRTFFSNTLEARRARLVGCKRCGTDGIVW